MFFLKIVVRSHYLGIPGLKEWLLGKGIGMSRVETLVLANVLANAVAGKTPAHGITQATLDALVAKIRGGDLATVW